MSRSLAAACALAAVLALPLQAQVTSPTNLTQIRPGSLLTVQSLTVKDGAISLIGTNGRTLSLPDGTFAGPAGASIIVATGMVAWLTPPVGTGTLSTRRIEIQGATVEGGVLYLIGTNGRRHTLADGTWATSGGASIVVQNRTITKVIGG